MFPILFGLAATINTTQKDKEAQTSFDTRGYYVSETNMPQGPGWQGAGRGLGGGYAYSPVFAPGYDDRAFGPGPGLYNPIANKLHFNYEIPHRDRPPLVGPSVYEAPTISNHTIQPVPPVTGELMQRRLWDALEDGVPFWDKANTVDPYRPVVFNKLPYHLHPGMTKIYWNPGYTSILDHATPTSLSYRWQG